MTKTKEYDEYVTKLEKDLIADYGYLLSTGPLLKLIGFRSRAAFDQGVIRLSIPIPIFTIEKRRGKFALTKDVAEWLAKKRFEALDKHETMENSK